MRSLGVDLERVVLVERIEIEGSATRPHCNTLGYVLGNDPNRLDRVPRSINVYLAEALAEEVRPGLLPRSEERPGLARSSPHDGRNRKPVSPIGVSTPGVNSRR